MSRLVVTVLALAAALVAVVPAAASADTSSPNMELVANFPYAAQHGDVANYGTDVEFATTGRKRYAFAGSEINGLQIFDITSPRQTRRVTTYDCAVSQGDVQTFKRGRRTYVTYTNDYETSAETARSACFTEVAARGLSATNEDGTAKLGTFVIDVTRPARPKAVSFVGSPRARTT